MLARQYKTSLALVAATLAVQVFLLVPLGLYLSNPDEMNVALLPMLRLLLVPVLAAFLVLMLAGLLLPAALRPVWLALLAGLGILGWLQANVLVWDYGVLDGRLIDWQQGRWRGWVDASLWVTGLGAALVLARTRSHWLVNAAVALVAVQVLALAATAFQVRDNINHGQAAAEENLAALYRFSPRQNIVHIMLDGFQSDVFSDLMQAPGLGDFYRNAFAGFTYYPETLGVFPYTRFSIPAFLGARFYANDVPQDDFVDTVLAGSNIINTAKAQGFAIDIAAGGAYLEKRYAHLHHDHLYNLDNVSSALYESARMLDIGLFRLAPHFFKQAVYNRQHWLLSPLFAAGPEMQQAYFRHTWFLSRLTLNLVADRSEPVYKYIHVMNTHNPLVVDEQCQLTWLASDNRERMTLQAKCTLDSLVTLFTRMKQLGIYENSLIIMHADHGSDIPNHRQGKPAVFIDGSVAEPRWSSLASPLLAIKPPAATGPLQVSPVLVSLADLPDTISDIMGWGQTFGQASVLRLQEGQLRPRRYHVYGWRENEWNRKYASAIQEFIITGSHYEVEWQLGRLFFPPEE